MAKEVIAVDVDEVLLPHFKDLTSWYNEQYGTNLTLANYRPKDPRPWGTSNVDEAIKRVHKFFETPEFIEAKPFDEATSALQKLRGKYELLVITSRDTIVEEVTRDWLEQHFPGVFKEAHFTAFYSLSGQRRSKTKVAQELNTNYLIDDDLDHINEAAEAGITGLLFGDYPWNQAKELPHNVIRVKNWQAVLEYFDAKS